MSVVAKNIGTPDEVRTIPSGNGKGSIVFVGDMSVIQGEVQPGWRWSNDIRPLVGTTSCEFAHTGIILQGCLHIEMDDGTSIDLRAGDVYSIPAGHDAWTVGDEVMRSIDWAPNNANFAKPTT